MEITSVNNPLVKDAVKLHQKKYRDLFSLFIVEGYHLFEEASKSGIVKYVFTTDRNITGDNVHFVTNQVLEKIAKTKTPQKIICVCNKFEKTELSERVLILNSIQDPGNLGTLLRSALAFNFKTVILDNTVDLYNEKVVRATQGAMFYLNIVNMKAAEFIDKHPNYNVYGTSFDGISLENVKSDKKIAIILGNEGKGVSKDLLELTSNNITIKTDNVESLNVGVAGSIIMHYINNN